MSSLALSTSNGHGSARPVVRGVSLAHRTKLSKSQRAVLVADVLDGRRLYQPTRVDLATLVGVSVSMIAKAQRLSPAARQTIMKGAATLPSFATPPLRGGARGADFVTVMEAAE